MPKNDKRKFQGSNQQILGLNREFAVGDRICKRTLGGGLSLPNTPALKGAKHGVVKPVNRKLSAPKDRKLVCPIAGTVKCSGTVANAPSGSTSNG